MAIADKTKNAIGLLNRNTLLRGSFAEFKVAPSLLRLVLL